MRDFTAEARTNLKTIQDWIDRIYEDGPRHPGELDEALEEYYGAAEQFFEVYDKAHLIASQEHWKPAPRYEGLYDVSDMGRVINLRTGDYLRPFPKNQSTAIRLVGHEGKKAEISVARLVLRAWCPIQFEKLFVPDWVNGDRSDNQVSNLRWKRRRPCAKLSDEKAESIRTEWAAGGTTYADLGRKYGVSPASIGNVINEITYARLP